MNIVYRVRVVTKEWKSSAAPLFKLLVLFDVVNGMYYSHNYAFGLDISTTL